LQIEGKCELEYKTVYFDTPDYKFYMNHHNGILDRFKIRMRTYKVSNQSFLELKRKTNRGKIIKNRKPIDKISDLTDENINYLNSLVSLNSNKLIRSVENSFNRITLLSHNKNERVTLDYNLKFMLNDNVKSLSFISVIEVKNINNNSYSAITEILKKIRIYPTSFSKYCMAMAYLHPNLKQNSFKFNKLALKKIEYDTTINN